ncbi:MAG TPA: 6-phosphofructokinase [Stellaceae bacterium]|nr:6-phosphofructokinase [Stellaceae bacterium]
MALNTATLCITPEILSLIAEIDEFKGAWRAIGRIAPERLSGLRRVATIESIGSSTRIEGAQLSDRDVENLLANIRVGSFTTRDEQEVAGYAEVLETVFSASDAISLTDNHIRQLHRDLLAHSTKDERHRGSYKTLPNHVEAFDENSDSRAMVLGHLQRGGSPVATDRIITSALGTAVVDLVAAGRRDCMVAWTGEHVVDLPLSTVPPTHAGLDPDGPLVATARALGISFGD